MGDMGNTYSLCWGELGKDHMQDKNRDETNALREVNSKRWIGIIISVHQYPF
jgi:hypothetical protein